MRWTIKCPAPSDSRLKKWGDYHFARCLAKYLVRLGDEVAIDYDPHWQTDAPADVVLVLRGKYPYVRSGPSRDAVHVMWNISHPADVSVEEYASYDIVCVASHQHAAWVRERVRVPVYPLLQCTDDEEFFEPAEREQPRRGFVFVGNTRAVRRDIVCWAVELGLPLEIWGRGWSEFVPERYVRGRYLDNEQLGAFYANARVTLNDHWPDMRAHGFINNRIFDALACGLPVISDRHPALEALLPDAILYCGSKEELEDALEQVLLEYPLQLERVRAAREAILQRFSFRVRAEKLRALAELELRGRRHRAHRPPTVEELAARAETTPRFCPVCQEGSDAFAPGGVRRREDAKCPRCGALERHRLVWLYLSACTDLFDGKRRRLLHVAPEKHYAPLLWRRDDIEYVSADLESLLAMEPVDLTSIAWPDASFDVVICNHVLEHIPDDAAAMRELRRVLAPGGWAILQVPLKGATTREDPSVTSPEERARLFGQSDHVRMYGRDYRDRLEAAGFEVRVDDFGRRLPEAVRTMCGIRDQDVYLCRRPLEEREEDGAQPRREAL